MTSYRDWVVETSSTTGTGAYALSGAAPAGTSYFTFRQRYANGDDEVVYWVVNADRTKWEKNQFGTLTYGSPDTLSRNVVESTNGDAAVTWVGGDAPLRLYVVPDASAEEFTISMGLGTSRPGVLKFGIWADQDDVSSGIHSLKLFDGTSDITIGRVDTVQHKFLPAGVDVGDIKPTIRATAPTGWLLCSGLTIGNAASGGTARANADTLDLFTELYNSFANAQAAVSGGRGASAAADYAANKTIALPDLRGRTIAGQDDMGGTSANRLTSTSGLDGDVLGNTGGDERLHGHVHTIPGAAATGFGVASDTGFGFSVGTGTSTGTTGGGSSQNVQPTIILNYVIKL